MFGALYFSQVPVATVEVQTATVRTGGGGWSHRGRIPAMPARRPSGLPSLPTLPKPPYLYLTPPTDG